MLAVDQLTGKTAQIQNGFGVVTAFSGPVNFKFHAEITGPLAVKMG